MYIQEKTAVEYSDCLTSELFAYAVEEGKVRAVNIDLNA